jgi:hypothetical protein
MAPAPLAPPYTKVLVHKKIALIYDNFYAYVMLKRDTKAIFGYARVSTDGQSWPRRMHSFTRPAAPVTEQPRREDRPGLA